MAERTITIQGEALTIWKASERFGVDKRTLLRHLDAGMPPDDAVRLRLRRAPEEKGSSKEAAEMIRSSDEREARAMIACGRTDAEIAEWLGWDLAQVAAIRQQVPA